ncbi:MAG: hypothetical protein IPK17_09595 [Chloroflexi bacterium]|uniref:hypothetical protein n=1 Tax=Candidatus Flexifilum breve TaxID=3140694 RepID=UPI00313466A9|nr:hypothetical protein [Chloroflexota bacterium]
MPEALPCRLVDQQIGIARQIEQQGIGSVSQEYASTLPLRLFSMRKPIVGIKCLVG